MGLGVGTVIGGTMGGKGHLSVTQVYPSTSAFCVFVSKLYMRVHLFEYMLHWHTHESLRNCFHLHLNCFCPLFKHAAYIYTPRS